MTRERRPRTTTIIRNISRSTLFSGLDSGHLEKVASIAWEEQFEPGQVIFRRGDVLSKLWVVVSGTVQLATEIPLWSAEVVLRSLVETLRRGDTLGWFALVNPFTATWQAEAVNKVTLCAVAGPELRSMMDQDTSMGYQVMTALSALIASRSEAARQSVLAARARDASHLWYAG